MRLRFRQTLCSSAIGLTSIIVLAGCSDGSDSYIVGTQGPGPAPMAPELIMDKTTPAPGFKMSFPDGVAVFPGPNGEEIFFNENNRQRRILVSSIDNPPLIHGVAIEKASEGGKDSNGQICQDAEGNRYFGEDTGQSATPPVYAGWGVFDQSGNQIGKLTPTSISTNNNSEPFGCGFARDGSNRLFTAEVGSQSIGAGDGQLIVWFPDPVAGFKVWPGDVPASGYPNSEFSRNYCKIATDLSTASSIAVDEDNNVYVANTGNGTVVVFRPPFPTGPNFEGGCSGTDITGAPIVKPDLGDTLNREVFIKIDEPFFPSGIVQSPTTGNWYVSGVFDGKILEFSPDGKTVYQTILEPSGDAFAPGGLPLASGHPYGLALDSKGTLYFTDMQLGGKLPSVGPTPGEGKLWRIRFNAE